MAQNRPRPTSTRGVYIASNSVLHPIQGAANRRGHGNRTAGAAGLGAIGAALGSFGGPLGALLLGGAGAWLGAKIGDGYDRGGR